MGCSKPVTHPNRDYFLVLISQLLLGSLILFANTSIFMVPEDIIGRSILQQVRHKIPHPSPKLVLSSLPTL